MVWQVSMCFVEKNLNKAELSIKRKAVGYFVSIFVLLLVIEHRISFLFDRIFQMHAL